MHGGQSARPVSNCIGLNHVHHRAWAMKLYTGIGQSVRQDTKK